MNKLRKCSKCNKVRKCSKHNDGCKNEIRPLCLKCQRAYFKDWYSDPINRQRKLDYQRAYYWSRGAYLDVVDVTNMGDKGSVFLKIKGD